MFTHLIEWFNALLQTVSGGEPVVKGFISMGLLTALGFAARRLPRQLARFTLQHTTVSLSMLRDCTPDMITNDPHMTRWFAKWVATLPSRRFNLSCQLVRVDGRWQVIPGVGTHVFVFQRRLYWYTHKRLPSNGSVMEKEEIIVYTYGRDLAHLECLVDQFAPDRKKQLTVYAVNRRFSGFTPICTIPTSPPPPIVLAPGLEEEVFGRLRWFLDNEAWYRERGLAYKLTFLFSGDPGTGKSSLIRAIATYCGYDVYQLDVIKDGEHFDEHMRVIPRRSVVSVEDFDDAPSMHDRDADTAKVAVNATQLTLGTMLNSLEGVVQLDGIITVLTTNKVQKIDPALIRKGRIDHHVVVGPLGDAEVHRYIQRMFPGEPYDATLRFAAIKACDLQAHFLTHPQDITAFIAALPKIPAPALECVRA